MTYYNENDPSAAEWLRELIKAGLIPPGEIDKRSITDVTANDLRGFRQLHFFAGIGGWARALEIAGWPEEKEIWTGSCPCQPFSVAGKGKAQKDERHLWPEFFRLIRECRPEFVMGEQVPGAIAKGWLDGICDDLESQNYAVRSRVLGAHSAGAPHIRQRLYWLANNISGRCGETRQPRRVDAICQSESNITMQAEKSSTYSGADGGLADDASDASPEHGREPGSGLRRQAGPSDGAECRGDNDRLADSEHEQYKGRISGCAINTNKERSGETTKLTGHSTASGVVNSDTPECGEQCGSESISEKNNGVGCSSSFDGLENSPCLGRGGRSDGNQAGNDGALQIERPGKSFWGDFGVIYCQDDKTRRIPQSVFLGLADGLPSGMGASGNKGDSRDNRSSESPFPCAEISPERGFPLCKKIPGRVMLLKGFGNAINPYTAAEFITSFLEDK